MNEERIDQIVQQLYSRTAWGVCADVAELTEAKTKAKLLIEHIDIALADTEDFVKRYMANPTAPSPPEEEDA